MSNPVNEPVSAEYGGKKFRSAAFSRRLSLGVAAAIL